MAETSTCYLTLNLRVRRKSSFKKTVVQIFSVGKIFELKETYNLKDISRIRNPKAKQYFFREKNFFFFISNNIQVLILDTDIVPAISSDNSAILISFSKEKQIIKAPDFASLIIRHCLKRNSLLTYLKKS